MWYLPVLYSVDQPYRSVCLRAPHLFDLVQICSNPTQMYILRIHQNSYIVGCIAVFEHTRIHMHLFC